MIEYEKFWFDRAKRPLTASIDNVDRFTCLWISFNGWLKRKYSELVSDRDLMDKIGDDEEAKDIFRDLIGNVAFSGKLLVLKKYEIIDARRPEDSGIIIDDQLKTLIAGLYQIRCNLFHGRKGTNQADLGIINSAYEVLLPLAEKLINL